MCSSCSKNRAARIAQRNNMQRTGLLRTQTLSGITFHELYYIGPIDVEIPSVIPHVSYGIKQYGELMFVADEDYQLHIEWWTNENPNSINNS